jgi:alpha-galactosidase
MSQNRVRSAENLATRFCLPTGLLLFASVLASAQQTSGKAEVKFAAHQSPGIYAVRSAASSTDVLAARFGAKVNQRWLYSTEYPRHSVSDSSFRDEFGGGKQITLVSSGLAGQPDLLCFLRVHSDPRFAFAEIEVQVRNSTGKILKVQAIRVLDATRQDAIGHDANGHRILDLNGPDAADRVLSDSFSEDRPGISILDLAQAPEATHRAVGSQLVFNRESKQSLFLGALTSERWLTVLRLHVSPTAPKSNPTPNPNPDPKIQNYEVDCTGTTELTRENSLAYSPPEDRIELSLPVSPGKTLASERVLVSIGADYHAQLESYGDLIRRLHHARVSAPTPIGWWSWTAYYFGLTEPAALDNAQVLASHLKEYGYNFFHIDEGYQYARGEYSTPNATHFPHGVKSLEDQVRSLGLIPGIWTSPFQVSERSWIYSNHKDWLVRNARGRPIYAGFVSENTETREKSDRLYVLDATNPGAQQYLRKTYTVLVKDWGIRYIKLDFMEDSAIEGVYYLPNTTALQAQRIGLQIIRDAVGDDVLLDKDGSTMLNPVGLVDTGRISVDTGHTYSATKEAAPGIAARYYMNRNFYISDPDAFTVSTQTVAEQKWHGGKTPLTIDEAMTSIALSAVSGGMYEIGDDLPTLFSDESRMALLKNRTLIDMARAGHASKPVDLMTYAPEDSMPSVFLLKESARQSILTVFNWTDAARNRALTISDLGLQPEAHYQIVDVLASATPVASDPNSISLGTISMDIAPHSVRMLKIIDTSVAEVAPAVTVRVPPAAEVGKEADISAAAAPDTTPVLSYRWDFGDGTGAEGTSVRHAFTHAGTFAIHLTTEGIDGASFNSSSTISVTGSTDPRFAPKRNKRYVDEH